jgi:hypothetical protein
MATPGFSAEASIYRSDKVYRIASAYSLAESLQPASGVNCGTNESYCADLQQCVLTSCPPNVTACSCPKGGACAGPCFCDASRCPAGYRLEAGATISNGCPCVPPCPKGEGMCAGACTNLQSHPNNCGTCGHVCGPGQQCQNGKCTQCPSGSILCSGRCVSIYTDPSHCGACGHDCPQPPYSVATCTDGVCGLGCQFGAQECGGACCPSGSCCNGACKDLGNDNQNCGSCGKECAGWHTCQDGVCIGKPCSSATLAQCERAALLTYRGCKADCVGVSGANCLNDCTAELHAGLQACRDLPPDCPGDIVCCRGACTDPADFQTDPSNCGICGSVCQDGTTCQGGACLCPGNGQPLNTPSNCGSCGNVCNSACCINNSCTSVPSLTSISNSPNTCNSSQNTNYWLAATNCENVLELSVTLMVNGALSTEDGFALQLNAVPPQNAQQINWMQYIFVIDGANLNVWVEYWQADGGSNCMAFSNQYEGFWGLSNCCSNGNFCSFWDFITDNCNNSIYYGLPTNSIPALYQLTISFTTDQDSGNVTAANFQMTDNDGNPFGTVVNIPTEVQVPIQSFQFVAVGQDNCASTTFTSADPSEIVYNLPENTNQQLCIQGASILCSGQANSFGGFTGESSNATYGTITSCCGSQLAQLLIP